MVYTNICIKEIKFMFIDTSGLKTTLVAFFRLNIGIKLMLLNHFAFQIIFCYQKETILTIFSLWLSDYIPVKYEGKKHHRSP